MAARLFPFDVRYRIGPAQLVLNSTDDAAALAIIGDVQRGEPNSPTLAYAMMMHALRLGDQAEASEQFYRLVHLAPNAAITKALLSGRHDP